MAVQATFIADFTKWDSALSNAQKNLKSFEVSAKGVQRQVEGLFKGFSGDRVIREAKAATAAIQAIGGVSKLTAAEQKRVSATVTEALAKYKALGQSAPKELQKIHGELKSGQSAWKSWFATIAGGVAIGNLLASAFRTALGFLGSIPGRLVELGKRGSEVAQVERSFKALTSAIGESGDEMLRVTRGATKNLISDMDIMASVNKGLLLGLPITAKEMGVLSKTAVVLGGAMRVGPTQAMSDLITGLGRGSAMILDNLGITVKAEDAYKKYGASIGKASGELTEGEKKLAIYRAALESAGIAVANIGDIQLTFAERIQQAKTFFDNFTDSLGVAIATSPVINAAFESMGQSLGETFGTDQTQLVRTLMKWINETAIVIGKMALIAVDAAGLIGSAWSAIKTVVLGALTAVMGGVAAFVRGAELAAKSASFLSPWDQNLKRVAGTLANTRAQLDAMTGSLAKDTVEASKGVVAQGAFHDAVRGTKTALEGAVAAMSAAAKKKVEDVQITNAIARATQTQTGATKQSAEAMKKAAAEADKQRKALEGIGIVTEQQLNKALAELVTLEKRAVAEGVPLDRVLAALYPKFAELAKQAAASGISVDKVAAAMARARAQFAPAVEEMAAWEAANVAAGGSLDELLRTLPSYSAAAEVAQVDTEALAEAMKRAGITSREELSKAARQAEADWRRIVTVYGEGSREATAAYKVMIETQRAETGKLPSVWEKEVFPRIKDVVVHLKDAVNGSFAQMLLGAKGFKDGFVDIWNSIKAAILNILNSILSYFINSFLNGLIGALMGKKGAFQQAFAGLFGGVGGESGGGGGGILDGIVNKYLSKWLTGGGTALAGAPGTVTAGIPSMAGIGTTVPVGTGGVPGLAGSTPWWSTTAGGAAIGAGAGIVAGELVGGRTGNKAGGAAAGAGTGAAVGGMLGGPIGAGVGAAVGAAWGWWAAKRANKDANDLRDQFFQAYGAEMGKFKPGSGVGSTFADLAGELTKATGEAGGGKLFQDLIKANDPRELEQAIAAVNAELQRYRAETASAVAAEEQHAAQIAEVRQEFDAQRESIKSNLKALDDELAQLNASEKPEAVMGTIEKRTRARLAEQKKKLEADLADVQKRMEEAIAAIGGAAEGGFGEVNDSVTDMRHRTEEELARMALAGKRSAQELIDEWHRIFDRLPGIAGDAAGDAAAIIKSRLGDIKINIPIKPEIGEFSAIPMAHGGRGVVTKPTLFLAGEAGREEVAFSGSNQTFGGSGGVTVAPLIIVGTPTAQNVDEGLNRLALAVPAIRANKAGIRTELREALGV